LTLDQPHREEEALNKAASFLAQALREVQQAGGADTAAMRRDIADSRGALEQLAARLEQQLAQEQEQRLVMAGQLTGLTNALDRLVSHLQSLSQLMVDLLERLAEPAPAAPGASSAPQPTFPAGGEGVSLTLTGVPGFQVLMELQKGLQSLAYVAGASVERFQEGDSRILLHLSSAAGADEIASGLHAASGQAIVVEESRPELLQLRLKVLPA
jgi:hypothetical protein